ncbi:hypothetical protein D3C77_721730 [compost metagenome]
MIGVTPFCFQAHQKTWRYRQRAITRCFGGCLVGVDRVGFANGFGKKTQAALFNVTAGHTQ